MESDFVIEVNLKLEGVEDLDQAEGYTRYLLEESVKELADAGALPTGIQLKKVKSGAVRYKKVR